MSEPLFDIIFRGDIVLGHNIVEVKAELAKLFKVDAAKIEGLFSGAAKPLKRGLDQARAEKYKEILTKVGALVEIKAVTIEPAIKAQQAPAKKVPLAERLAAQAAAAEAVAEQAEPTEPESPAAQTRDTDPLMNLAPVGEDLLRESERREEVVAELVIPDVSIRESGEDLLDASERNEFVPLDLDLSAYLLADAGEDLVKESERAKPETVTVDIGSMDLAPVGADMGQIEKGPPPPPPDTSGLSLSE